MSPIDYWLAMLGAVIVIFTAWSLFGRRSRAATVRVASGGPVRRAAGRGLARLWRAPDVLRVVALALLAVAFANPQVEDRTVLTGEGADIVIALDMSGSMNAVDRTQEEIDEIQAAGREPLNRFQAAREIIKAFVANRREDRVGLIVFGREVFLKFPLTLDYRVVLDQLGHLVLDNGRHEPDAECDNDCTINGAGTAIGDALARSYRRLRDSKAKTKAIVLITDGRREGGKLAPRTVARFISERPEDEKVRVYTFLVGSPAGAKLPAFRRELDPRRGWVERIARDPDGRVIYGTPERPFSTDPALLKDIADLTGGRFFEAYDEAKFREYFDELEKTEFQMQTRSIPRPAFFPWLIAGLVALGLEWVLRLTALRRFP